MKKKQQLIILKLERITDSKGLWGVCDVYVA